MMTRRRPAPRRHLARVGLELLESRQVLSAMVGLTAANELATFDSARPDVILSMKPVSGLQAGETLLAIDSRPSTGQVYGLGSTGRLYTLDPATGGSLPVGSAPLATPLSGTEFDVDFDPLNDILRLVSDAGQDLRINPDTAEVTVDPNLAYAVSDSGAGTTPAVLAAAYSNNVPGGFSALFEFDAKRDALVTQGSTAVFGNPPSQNSGQLFTVAPLSQPISGHVGLEFVGNGPLLASLDSPDGSGTMLYQVNTGTGALSAVGEFPGSIRIKDIASLPRTELVYAVNAQNRLISFRSSTPGTLLQNQAILGLQPGETIASIDFRPATGDLIGLGTSGRLYTINTSTATATPISNTPINPALSGSHFSINVDPTTDRIRLVSNTGQDLRIDPNTGAVVAIDGALAYAPGDPASALSPSVVAEGYTYNSPGAAGTTLLGIDSRNDTFITQGSVGGVVVSPNTGQLFSQGPLGRDATDDAGLDVSTGGVVLATLTDVGASSSVLYAKSLSTGKPTPIGKVGGGAIIRDMAIAPAGFAQFSAAMYTVSSTAGSATIVVTRIAGSSGPGQVSYRTSDGTARAGTDYSAVSGVLEFADGETTKSFRIPILGNQPGETTRTVNLSLSPLSGGILLGPIGTALLSIQSLGPVASPGVRSATFRGMAATISAVDITFNGPVDPVRANDLANYLVTGQTSGRPARGVTIALISVTFDIATSTAHLVFSRPIALSSFRSLQVTARGFGSGGFDSRVNYTVLRGSAVRYVDTSGNHVLLGAIGRGAKVVVVRRTDGSTTSAWVDGNAKTVFGVVIPRRRSSRTTVIDRFVTNGATLRLPNSFVVKQQLLRE